MIRKYIEDYLTFSKTERNAVIGLSLILLILFALPKFLPQDKIEIDSRQRLSFTEDKPGAEPARVFDSGASTGLPSSESASAKRVYFDPNTLGIAGWVSMGVKEKTATTIQHYLEKGGRFRKAEDLQKVYGLPAELATELMEYVRIADGLARSGKVRSGMKADETGYGSRIYPENAAEKFSRGEGSSYAYSRNFSRTSAAVYSSRKIHSGTIDIATADTSALTTLPGIGSKLAARIVSFREKLGGFHMVEQFKEVFGIQDSIYQKIKPMLVVSAGHLTRININTASEEMLKAHPYIRWQLAKLIVSYRKEHGNFSAANDLKNLQTMNSESIEKLVPYLEF